MSTLPVITKHLICLYYLLELVFTISAVNILIRVILYSQVLVCLFYLIIGSITLQTQHLIKVPE